MSRSSVNVSIRTLDDNKEEILIRSYHHLVLLALNTEEGQVVVRV